MYKEIFHDFIQASLVNLHSAVTSSLVEKPTAPTSIGLGSCQVMYGSSPTTKPVPAWMNPFFQETCQTLNINSYAIPKTKKSLISDALQLRLHATLSLCKYSNCEIRGNSHWGPTSVLFI